MARKKKNQNAEVDFEARIKRSQDCDESPEGVTLHMVRTPYNTWGCYIDGTLAEWGGGVMTAKQILRALAGRGVTHEYHVEVARLPEDMFPRDFEDLEIVSDDL